MNSANEKVKAFFEGVERASNTLDLELIATQYADVFMFADPSGTRVIEKGKLLAALPQRQAFFKRAGHQFTRILSYDETWLDARYVLVHVHFLMRFQTPLQAAIDAQLDSTYVLYLAGDALQIVFHLESDDVQQALRARGVLPAD